LHGKTRSERKHYGEDTRAENSTGELDRLRRAARGRGHGSDSRPTGPHTPPSPRPLPSSSLIGSRSTLNQAAPCPHLSRTIRRAARFRHQDRASLGCAIGFTPDLAPVLSKGGSESPRCNRIASARASHRQSLMQASSFVICYVVASLCPACLSSSTSLVANLFAIIAKLGTDPFETPRN